jgi:hypothetical protein
MAGGSSISAAAAAQDCAEFDAGAAAALLRGGGGGRRIMAWHHPRGPAGGWSPSHQPPQAAAPAPALPPAPTLYHDHARITHARLTNAPITLPWLRGEGTAAAAAAHSRRRPHPLTTLVGTVVAPGSAARRGRGCRPRTHGRVAGAAAAAVPVLVAGRRAQRAHQRLRAVLEPARPFPSSIFRDKNRGGIGKSQPRWTACKMETPGAPPPQRPRGALHRHVQQPDHVLQRGAQSSQRRRPPLRRGGDCQLSGAAAAAAASQ